MLALPATYIPWFNDLDELNKDDFIDTAITGWWSRYLASAGEPMRPALVADLSELHSNAPVAASALARLYEVDTDRLGNSDPFKSQIRDFVSCNEPHRLYPAIETSRAAMVPDNKPWIVNVQRILGGVAGYDGITGFPLVPLSAALSETSYYPVAVHMAILEIATDSPPVFADMLGYGYDDDHAKPAVAPIFGELED